MSVFAYKDGELYAEGVSLASIGDSFGTPCYVYSKQAIIAHWQAFETALSAHRHLICYAVKANANLAVLNILARLGSGFDIVSAGELERVLQAGGSPDRIVFSGVGKQAAEIEQALTAGIKCFNVESVAELTRINAIASAQNRLAPVSLRINPDIDAKTHPYIATGLKENKFGIAFDEALAVYQQAVDLSAIEIVGIDCHIGSQIMHTTPFKHALTRLLGLVAKLKSIGISLQHIDIGGGFGIAYQKNQKAPKAADYIDTLQPLLDDSYEWIIEPGRAIVGNAGILLTRVEYLKPGEKHFAIIDAGMNDLLRPALYQGAHNILPITQAQKAPPHNYDVVGPICETADCFARDCRLSIQQGDLLAILSAGAYGFTMSSQYNARPRSPEIMVDGTIATEVRAREELAQLWQGERMLPIDDR